jgi:hypothetical protein
MYRKLVLTGNKYLISHFSWKDDLHVGVVRMAAADEGALRSVQLGSLARSLLTQRSYSGGLPNVHQGFSDSVADPDPSPDPTPLFSDFKDANKIIFFSYFFLLTKRQALYLQSLIYCFKGKFCVKILFCQHYFSPLNTL